MCKVRYGRILPQALIEWVTMLIVTREGDRRCKLRPSQRALVALVDGTIAEGNRIRDRESGYSGKTRRHGVNIQAATGPAGELL